MNARTYDHAMARGAGQYSDVLDSLMAIGLRSQFIQTGGMCAAIEARLDSGHYVLFTDRDGPLSWDRAQHQGWRVALYEPEESSTADGPLRCLVHDDGSPPRAVELAHRVLRLGTDA